MNQRGNNKKLAQEWFDIANDEFNFAKAGFEELESFYPQICFQCQQAVEKYLKGFLVLNNSKFPKTHDLSQLLKLCEKIDKNFTEFFEKTDILSQYYLVSRYPLEYPSAKKEQAKEALNIAAEIINFIKIKIEF